MKKTLLLIICAFVSFIATAQNKTHKIAFYNIENFFDIYNDPEVNDDEFTPDGPKQWNEEKYAIKLANIEKVIFGIASIDKDYPVVMGFCEVENRSVLEDIIATPKLAPGNYRIAHVDSHEKRGVDVAFIYRPDVFKIEGEKSIQTVIPEIPDFRTRDIMTIWGTIEGERFMFIVCHWPSRWGGQASSDHLRVAVANQVRGIVDAELAKNPDTKIVLMGDLNDDPTNNSMVKGLRAVSSLNEVKKDNSNMFNPFASMHKAGLGTLAYRDAWNLFDNIIVTSNLALGSSGSLKLVQPHKSKYLGNIFKQNYLFQSEGQYKGYPLRTYIGNNFQGGFSDHLPVYIYIGK